MSFVRLQTDVLKGLIRGNEKVRLDLTFPKMVRANSAKFTSFDVEYIYGFVCRQSRRRHSVTVPHTRWRLYVTMETLWQQQDVIDVFYIFNSTVVD